MLTKADIIKLWLIKLIKRGGVNILIGLEFIIQISNIGSTDVAEKLGIRKQNISRWFSGDRPLPEKYLPQLEDIFNLPKEYFSKELNENDKIKIQQIKVATEKISIETKIATEEAEILKEKLFREKFFEKNNETDENVVNNFTNLTIDEFKEFLKFMETRIVVIEIESGTMCRFEYYNFEYGIIPNHGSDKKELLACDGDNYNDESQIELCIYIDDIYEMRKGLGNYLTYQINMLMDNNQFLRWYIK